MKILFSLKNNCLDFLHACHDTLCEAQLIKIIPYSTMQLLTYDKVADFVVWPVKSMLGVDIILLSSSAAQLQYAPGGSATIRPTIDFIGYHLRQQKRS